MTRTITLTVLVALLLLNMGCHSIPSYNGDGQISNTTYWADNLVRVRRYTIQFKSFPMNQEARGDIHVGNVVFFPKTKIFVYLRFEDEHSWEHFSKLHASLKTDEYLAKYSKRDIDTIDGRLNVLVSTATGKRVVSVNKSLKDFIWSGEQSQDGRRMVKLYDLDNATSEIFKGDDLKLSFSYLGDPSLTNHAELIVVCLKGVSPHY